MEEKESYRWLKGYEIANRIALDSPDTLIVSIADREGYIYEILRKTPSEENKAYCIIRSNSNRKTLGKYGVKLREAVKRTLPIGEIEFELPTGRIYKVKERDRTQRKKRMVRQNGNVNSKLVFM